MDSQQTWLIAIRLFAIVSCGLMAGLFFAFSNTVMRSLAKLPSDQAISAMQLLNVEIINPIFLLVFVGSVICCIATIMLSLTSEASKNSALAVSGAAIYLLGSIVVTAVFNIPRNNALAAISQNPIESAAFWSTYLSEWTFWNHIRLVAATVSFALLSLSLL
jgi:uncharacterized membrane protein